MFCFIFFILIIKTFEIEKFLYLGKHECNAIGNEAYLDVKTEDLTICSNEIPQIDQYSEAAFYPEETILTIIILDAGDYLGVENLANYPYIIILKNFTGENSVTFNSKKQEKIDAFFIGQIIVNTGVNLNMKVFQTKSFYNNINKLIIYGSQTKVNLTYFLVDSVDWILDSDLILDDTILSYKSAPITFQGQNTYKIIDNSQFLYYKTILLDGTDLEYIGNSDYTIMQITYTGKEKISRVNSEDKLAKVLFLVLQLNNDFSLTEFVDANVETLQIKSDKKITLTIDTQNSVYLPIIAVINVIISSNGKIDFAEGKAFQTTDIIELSSFSGKTPDGGKIKVLYQIYNSIAYSCIFTNDLKGYEFSNCFLQYPLKSIISKNELIMIYSTHFEGSTILNNISFQCMDSECQVDSLGTVGTGKLYDGLSNEIKPKYFTFQYSEIQNIERNIVFQPLVADVRNYNDFSFSLLNTKLEFKQFNGKDKTYYKFLHDIEAKKIIIDDNIEAQFDCNIFITEPLSISQYSSIINSPESGISVTFTNAETTFDSIASTYNKHFSKIIFRNSYYTFFAKHLVFKNIGSQSDEKNIITLMFTQDQGKELSLSKITACKGIHIEFQLKIVEVCENSIKIDKINLQPNPKFSTLNTFQMISTSNNELYINNIGGYIPIECNNYNKLYLEGKFELYSYHKNDIINISDLLYLKGELIIYQNIIEIFAKNIIFDNFITNDYYKFTVGNAIYTSMIDDFEQIQLIEAPKLIITCIDANQEITIQNKFLTLVKNNRNHKIDTRNHGKTIFYLPSTGIKNTLLEDEGNVVKLKVENSNNKHRVFDLNIISNSQTQKNTKSNEKSKLKIIIDDSIKTGNPQFEGNFGYAFESGLDGNIVFKEGDTGEETNVSPNYFPMNKVELEEFPQDDTTPVVPTPDDKPTPIKPTPVVPTPDDKPTQDDQPTNNPTNQPQAKTTEKKKLSKGAIAGIVIGCVVGVVIIVLVIILIIKRC